ncbi:hypothetical protein [Bacillus massilinigeriensis]|uniref:hypothetical protein n=1 Tax=Bacillus mediterraneensis TaxID=1805474 RepID=UPI0008F81718|nr:hypothetical protein [Bacillus mediterraneensis]
MGKAESNAGKDGSEASNRPKGMMSDEEFTSKFVDSTREIDEDYYLFSSNIGKYTMLFPKGAKISPIGYEKSGNEFEAFNFGEARQSENTSIYWDITYKDQLVTKDVDINLNIISNRLGYKGDFEKFSLNGKTYYYGKKVKNIEGQDYYSYFAYVQNDKDNRAIFYIMKTTSIDASKPFKDQKMVEEKAMRLIKSVEFVN